MCLVLYTDYTKLSSDFSATFRKNGPFEPLQQTQNRNRKYWHWSKILQETIHFFGDNNIADALKGPFFCGMSIVMNMPQLNICLLSPTSTSVQIQVAMKFSGQQGMIIEFSNEQGRRQRQLCAFDCSWISRYKEEDERYDLRSCFYTSSL